MPRPRPSGAEPAPWITAAAAKRLDQPDNQRPLTEHLHRREEVFTATLESYVWGFGKSLVRQHAGSVGLFFVREDFPAPVLWCGMAWDPHDTEDTGLSVGAMLEIHRPYDGEFTRDRGGLYRACRRAEQGPGGLVIHRHALHVDLALWRTREWLFAEPDPGAALVALWSDFLGALVAARVPEAIDRFVEGDVHL